MTDSGPQQAADRAETGGFIRRYLPLLVLLGIAVLVWVNGWHQYLSLEAVANSRDTLSQFVERNGALAVLLYAALYIAVVALSLPGGALLTITGGFLFGWLLGGGVTVIAATLGATLLFGIVKTSLGAALSERAGPWLTKLSAGFQENALSYLLFLRLVPAFPFWLVNLAPALLGVNLRTYVIGTGIGIIPGTLAFASVGAGLDSIIVAQQAAYESCLASGSSDCRFSLDAGALLTPQILAAFAALGLVALIPVVVQKLRSRNRPVAASE